MFNSFFRNVWGGEEPPTKVLEVHSDTFVSRPIVLRDESMLLYAPIKKETWNKREEKYEIVLHKPFTETLHQVYSLFRSESENHAVEKFVVFKESVPVFINITKDCSLSSLQKLCDTLADHKAWSITHIAAHFELLDLFNNPDIQSHLNDSDPVSGATPIMVAIRTGNLRLVKCLLALKCDLLVQDIAENTVMHYAAVSNKEIINVLSAEASAKQCLNLYNKDGYTPMHIACLSDLPNCVYALIFAGADVNLPAHKVDSDSMPIPGIVADVVRTNTPELTLEDIKRGGTPLHWAKSKSMIAALVDNKCNINALNFDGRTALHIMVMRGRLECAVALMAEGCQLNVQDSNGDTPLHLAVKESSVAIVQSLIVFGADLEIKNKDGFRPRHLVPAVMSSTNHDKILYVLHLVGAQRCSMGMSGCSEGCSFRGQYNGVPPPKVAKAPTRDLVAQVLAVSAMDKAADHNTKAKGRLLCLDGGGIKGLILIQTLIALERAVKRPIVSCFDWIAGTSTGGILALALARGKSLRECQSLYFKLKEKAFVGNRPYSSEVFESILKECLGTDVVMADIDRPKLMIMALEANRRPCDLHIFRNYLSPQEILEDYNQLPTECAVASDKSSVVSLSPSLPPAEQFVWRVARCTGAAPSYFRACDRYLDGGLISNNPTLDALTEISELKMALKATNQADKMQNTDLKLVISCGTGCIPVTVLKDIDLYKPGNLWDAAKVASSITAITNLLVDQATQSDGRVVDRARAWCSTLGVHYYRFSPQMSSDVAMDERNDETLVGILWEAAAYMNEHRDKVIEVATMLTM